MRSLAFPRALLLALSFPVAASLAAQTVTPLLREGDPLGTHTVKHLLHATIDDGGTWDAVVYRDLGTGVQGVQLHNGVVVASEFEPVPNDAADYVRMGSLEGGGNNLAMIATLNHFVPPIPSPTHALVRDQTIVIVRNELLNVTGLPADQVCGEIVSIAADGRGTVMAVVQLGSNGTALLRFTFAPGGIPLAREMLFKTGDVLPDLRVITDIGQVEVNERGGWVTRLFTSDSRKRLLSSSGTLARPQTPSPIAGRQYIDFPRAAYDLNDLGGFAFVARLEGNPADDTILVKNGLLLAQEGKPVPSLSPAVPPLPLAEFGRMRLSNSGKVYWHALTDSSAPGLGSFLRDGQPFLQAGVSTVAGELVTAFHYQRDNFEISPSGRFWIGQVVLATSGEAFVVADFGASIPRAGCTGNPGQLRHTQGLVLAGQTIRLVLDGPAPVGSLATLHFSRAAAVAGSDCGIASPFGEILIDPTQAAGNVAAGVFNGAALPVDLAIPPSAALVGRHFFAQGSFTGGGAVLTNALELEIGAP